jgi:hypothetical protein
MAEPTTKTEAISAWQRAKQSATRVREKAAAVAQKTVGTALVVGGGAAAGYIDGAYPEAELGGINAGLVLGAAGTIVGLADWAGRASPYIGDVGEGMLAYEIGKRVRDKTAGGTSGVGAGGDKATLADLFREVERLKAQRAA